jgi:hypothetical protein
LIAAVGAATTVAHAFDFGCSVDAVGVFATGLILAVFRI